MGDLWETRAEMVEIWSECPIEIPYSFHNGKSMGHDEHLSAGMGNLWYTLHNECPISMP